MSSSSVTFSPFCSFFIVSDTVTASDTDPPTDAMSDMNGRSDQEKSVSASRKPRLWPRRLLYAISTRRRPASVFDSCS